MSVSPTVTLLSATTHDSQSLSITYQVSDVAEFSITAFRSPNATYDGMNDPRDVVVDTANIDASVYPSSDTLSLSTPLSVDPSRPYVWVVASPTGDGTTDPYSETSFRIFTVGAVTHGFEFKPSDAQWVSVMADSLQADGYDLVVPFYWTAYSSLPIKGMTVLAGEQMATAILAQAGQQIAPQMGPNDVVALHMIGHSRGSAVISQAALDLQAYVALFPAWSPLLAGPWKMTFLDPHPAHNIPGESFYDAAPTPLGRFATSIYTEFQSLAQDPSVVVPAGVDWAEVYYQYTPVSQATDPIEKIWIAWGEIPVYPQSASTIVEYCDLTGTVFGHYAVHDWYQSNVVPLLSSDPGFVVPPSEGAEAVRTPVVSSLSLTAPSVPGVSPMLSSSGAAGSQPQHIKHNAKPLSVELRFAALERQLFRRPIGNKASAAQPAHARHG